MQIFTNIYTPIFNALMISASEMCIYTNDNFTIESLAMEEDKEEGKDGEEEKK